MKSLWDEKLPRIVDKGQHEAFGSIGSRPKLSRVVKHALHDDIFSSSKIYIRRFKINKTVEIIQMYHTIIRQRVIIQSNVNIYWEEMDLVSPSVPDNS